MTSFSFPIDSYHENMSEVGDNLWIKLVKPQPINLNAKLPLCHQQSFFVSIDDKVTRIIMKGFLGDDY